ncbi:MAG: thioredoxin family protein [Planctomycetota bacterium]|nr:thioredoxin family protein [Planctomycetota bacterium]
MKIQLQICLVAALWVAAYTAVAGEYNPVLDIGDLAPRWTALPATSGKRIAFEDFKDKRVLVVVFTCNSCPYAVDYEDRINAFARQHTGMDKQVALVAINVNKVEEDLLPAMKVRAAEKKFTFPYLFDETQMIARKFGAGYTPECFVLNQKREVVYMGAMDDSPDATKVKVRYLENAVAAALQGKRPQVTETVPIGCRIRIERTRRTRSPGKE